MSETFFVTPKARVAGYDQFDDDIDQLIDLRLRWSQHQGKFQPGKKRPNMAFVSFAYEGSRGPVFYLRTLKRFSPVRVLILGNKIVIDSSEERELNLEYMFASSLDFRLITDPVERALTLYPFRHELMGRLRVNAFDYGRLTFRNVFAEGIRAQAGDSPVGVCKRNNRFLVFQRTS